MSEQAQVPTVESVQVEPSNPQKLEKLELARKAKEESVKSAAIAEDIAEQERKAEELKKELASRDFIRPIAGRMVHFRRWGWITAQRILPQLLNISSAIFRLARAQSEHSQMTLEQLQKIVLDGTLAASLTPSMMNDLISIQAETLASGEMNKMTLEEAKLFLASLEVEDGMELMGYIYQQNVKMIAKNVLGLIAK